MSIRRTHAALAAVLSLLVSWTSGPGAVLCMPQLAMARPAESHPGHAAGHGGGHGAGHGAHQSPVSDHLPERAPVPDAPECPLAVMGGPSCLAPVAAPSARGWRPADLARAAEYPPPTQVRDQLLAAPLLRPPQA